MIRNKNTKARHRASGLPSVRSQRPSRMIRRLRLGTAAAALVLAVTLTGCGQAAESVSRSTAASSTKTTVKKPPKVVTAKITVAQEQALKSAQSYVDMTGFSKAGLTRQLTSEAGEGFTPADVAYAVKHVKVDWNAEAVEAAKAYLAINAFSRASLIRQLHAKAGSGFTLKQATYAADTVGL